MRRWSPQFRKTRAKRTTATEVLAWLLLVLALFDGSLLVMTLVDDRQHERDLLRVTHAQELEDVEARMLECVRRGQSWGWNVKDNRVGLDGTCENNAPDASARWTVPAQTGLDL